jgi:hypothetical protein
VNLALPIGIAVLLLLAVADIWLSRLSRPAKVLWTVNVLCLVGVGFVAWLLTRHTAYQSLDEYASDAPAQDPMPAE